MKFLPLLLLALVLIGLGCTATQPSGEGLSPETESQAFNDMNSTFIDENSFVEIGSMI